MIEGATPVKYFGGFGGFNVPKSAIKDGRLYVGEAAGFQDPARGFGMNYALETGKLAADSIINNQNYDELWKKQLGFQLKIDYASRFALSLFGDRIIDYLFRNLKDGDAIDSIKYVPDGLQGKAMVEFLYRAELFKKRLTGNW